MPQDPRVHVHAHTCTYMLMHTKNMSPMSACYIYYLLEASPSGPPSVTNTEASPSGPSSVTNTEASPSGPPSATNTEASPSGPPSVTNMEASPSGPRL